MDRIYMDNAATTAVCPEALAAMLPCFGEHYGNASSIHSTGRDARKLLEVIKKPADCDFTVRVSDELIPENNAVFRVRYGSVVPEEEQKAGTADAELNVRALGQLAVGCLNLDEAMLRKDVSVNAKEEMLRRVFVEKNIFVGEHF